MKLGFVGCGTIASAMVTGLCSTGSAGPITLSPRNAKVAAGLASLFANVQIAPTNQAVLDASEVVVLAVRPQIAFGVLSELRFRPDHHVVSLIATLPLERIRSVTRPAGLVTRAVPLPSVALRQGPTAIHPPSQPIKALFDTLGTAIELDDESEFDAFAAATAIMASYFGFASTISDWMTRNGCNFGGGSRSQFQRTRRGASNPGRPERAGSTVDYTRRVICRVGSCSRCCSKASPSRRTRIVVARVLHAAAHT
jgi:pyrroline-5-carboxylate reductase